MNFYRILFLLLSFCISLSAYNQDVTPYPTQPDPYITFWKKNSDSLAKQWICTQQNFYNDYNKIDSKIIASKVMILYDKLDSSNMLYKHPRTLEILQGYLLNSTKTEMAMAYFNFYSSYFEKIAIENGLPKELKYLPFVLSAMNNKAINENGAGGIWQIMYSNGLKQGLEIDSYVDERRNIEKATNAAFKELSEMNQLYSSIPITLLAYTCGPTNVTKAIRRSEYSRNIYDVFSKLPAPGRDVVFALSASIILFENASTLGLNVPSGTFAFESDTIEVSNRLHFSQIEDILSISMDKIRYLNPQYKLDIIPSVNESYTILLPKGSLSSFTNLKDSIFTYKDSILFNLQRSIVVSHPVNKPIQLPNTSGGQSNESRKLIYYTVKKGDNLGKIAKKFDVEQKEILSWNNLRSAKSLKAGKKLKIYQEQLVMNTTPPQPKVIDTSKTSQTPVVAKPNPPVKPNTNTNDYIIHTVKSGETLSVIAKKYPGATVEKIMKWNKLSSPDKLNLGQKLKIMK